jgi:hypothetical protein
MKLEKMQDLKRKYAPETNEIRNHHKKMIISDKGKVL